MLFPFLSKLERIYQTRDKKVTFKYRINLVNKSGIESKNKIMGNSEG